MDKAGFIFPTLFVLYVAAVLFCCFVRFESLPEVGRSFLGIPADKAAHFLMFLPWPALFSLAFPGMLKNRCFNVVLVTKDNPRPLNLDNPEGQLVQYNGKSLTVNL